MSNDELTALSLRGEINANHRECIRAGNETIHHACEAGRLLTKVKGLVKHGEFGNWIKQYCDFAQSTADGYMKLHKDLAAIPKSQRDRILEDATSVSSLKNLIYRQTTLDDKERLPDAPAGGPGHGAETQHQAGESRDAHPSAGASGNLGKCPNCAGAIWDEDDEGWACAKCHHPHGEPAGEVDGDLSSIQSSKAKKPLDGPIRTSGRIPIATFEIYEDGWVEAFKDFWKHCPGPIKLVIRELIQQTTRRGGGFHPPTVSEVRDYCAERKNGIDPEVFVDYYESVGWKIGNKPMKDWRAAVRTWGRKKAESGGRKNWLKEYLNRDKSKDVVK